MSKLIAQLVSLVMTLIVFIVCVYGWYVTNTEASVSGIVASTASSSFSSSLQYWDEDSWKDCSDSVTLNLEPGDAIYFKLEVKIDSGRTFKFNKSSFNIQSSITTDALIVKDSKIYYGNAYLYTLDDNSVKIDEKTLYSYGTSLALVDYKLGDFLTLYNATYNATSTPSIEDDTQADYITGTSEDGSAIAYFALKFEDDENSNYYAYQTVTLNRLYIDVD